MIRNRSVFRAFAAVSIGAIATLSFLPGGDKQLLHTEGRFHLPGHFFAFAAIGFLLALSVGSAWKRVLVLAIGAGLGYSIEFAQHYVYHFRIELHDVLMDILGISVGIIVAAAVDESVEN
jgi:VanZ family protein